MPDWVDSERNERNFWQNGWNAHWDRLSSTNEKNVIKRKDEDLFARLFARKNAQELLKIFKVFGSEWIMFYAI